MPGVFQDRIDSQDTTAGPLCRELNLVSEEEKRILLFLKLDEAMHFDKLYHHIDVDIGDLSERLINLELEGWIRRLPGNMYVRMERLPQE